MHLDVPRKALTQFLAMQWKNSQNRFGGIHILLHWLTTLLVFGLFALGWWMTELDYYHVWYQRGPWWHKSAGVLLFSVVIIRLVWRWRSLSPAPLLTHAKWEVRLARLVHRLLFTLLLMTMLSGYLISTADNRPIDVFGWFSVPATITGIPRQEDITGWIHLIFACVLVGLALLHALAALKHHFIDRDTTLLRMFGR